MDDWQSEKVKMGDSHCGIGILNVFLHGELFFVDCIHSGMIQSRDIIPFEVYPTWAQLLEVGFWNGKSLVKIDTTGK